jgi:hypothetical protein
MQHFLQVLVNLPSLNNIQALNEQCFVKNGELNAKESVCWLFLHKMKTEQFGRKKEINFKR